MRGPVVVQGYGGGGFRISGTRYEGAVLIVGERAMPWPVSAPADASLDSLAPVLAAVPAVELVLLGCGARAAPADPALRRGLAERGIGLEVMETGAACRTCNVLCGEGRRIAAALLPVA